MSSVELATEIVYRSGRHGDEAAIVAFLRECGYDPDLAFWHWINRACPHGQALVELALAQDRVIGHFGVLPRLVWMDGTMIRAGLALHAAVHPQFRGLAMLRELLQRMIQRCRREGMPFFYAFPRRDIWLMYSTLFDWRCLGEVVTLERPLQGSAWENRADPAIRFRERSTFDERYRSFNGSAWLSGTHHVVKDAAFARWRYEHHPRNQYPQLELLGEDGELLGYLLLKLYNKAGKRYGHWVDVGLKPQALERFPALAKAAMTWFAQQQVDVASCWMLPKSPLFATIQRMGFQPTGFTTYVGYQLVEPGFPTGGLDITRWHMMMGDSDAF